MPFLPYVEIFGAAFQNNAEAHQSQTEQVILDLILGISALEVQVLQKICAQKLVFIALPGEIVAG